MIETTLLILWLILGFALIVAGIAFCIMPVLPGPPLSFAGLILLAWVRDWTPFSGRFLIIMAGLMLFVLLLDSIVPLLGARKFGASRQGLWGSVLGMLAGIFVFPPWGIIIGAFVGALIGEIASGKERKEAIRVGWGIFVGTLVGVGMKLAYSLSALFFYIRGMIV